MTLTRLATIVATLCFASAASAVPISLVNLPGAAGGSPAATGIYRADLTSVGGTIASITINDNSSQLGGAGGQFSGFDLDAIVLSNTLCGDAACAAGLAGLAVFDFSPAGTIFTPGTQRTPADPKLFGTDGGGTNVDNSVVTLGTFDGNATVAQPPDPPPHSFGFVSMGDNGILSFNLTSSVDTNGLYLYIGEVGDNGEVAAGSIEVSSNPVPAPATGLLLALGLAAGFLRRR